MNQQLPAGVRVPEDLRPQIDDKAPLVIQIQDLDFYYKWINSRPWSPTQDDFDYYRLHLHRIQPLEDAWRAKRREHMISQARPFLEYVNPIHSKLARRKPALSEEVFKLLDIYDAACEFYVSLEFGKWTESQALRADQAVRKLLKENLL